MTHVADLTKAQTDRLHKFAHDLRNRLTGLHEALKHVSSPEVTDKQEIFEYGEKQFFKALREVEDLLDDMEIDRVEQQFEAAAVPLAEVVREAADDMRHRLEAKDQDISLELDPQLEVKGDRHLVTNSIASLLSNASKFSPRGTAVKITMARRNDQVELCVVDQGVGLTAEDLKNIFVRYAWLNSRSTEGEAQGRSSLSRAHGWAQGMGGTLTASSEGKGKGCAFTLRLPLA